jgi:hypothetical protein
MLRLLSSAVLLGLPAAAAAAAPFCAAALYGLSALLHSCAAWRVGEQSRDLLAAPMRLGLKLLLRKPKLPPCCSDSSVSLVSNPSNAPTRA